MTENLNSGVFNTMFQGILAHLPSMVGTTIFYIRNMTSRKVSFYGTGTPDWFSAAANLGAKVIKPPQPVLFPNTTTSAIVYISQGGLNRQLTICFSMEDIYCAVNFTYAGFREVIVGEKGKETTKTSTNDGNAVTICNLYSDVNLRTIWGYDICMIDVFDNTQNSPDLNI